MTNKDVYHLWLGISPQEQPPNHYRLLGVPLFETNTEVIRNAADRQLSHVKRLSVNDYVQVGQKLLDEIATAKLCLLRPEKRGVYDALLRERMGQASSLPSPKAMENAPPPRQQAVIESPSPPPATAIKNRVETDERPENDGMLVGSNPLCDFVVDHPAVSGIHCKILQREDHVYLRDLKSTNGTFVNGKKIFGSVEISPTDWITLGRETRFKPAASLFTVDVRARRVLFVGRHPACEIKRDDDSVSVLHARIIVSKAGLTVEDLGSTNGTFKMCAAEKLIALPPHKPITIENGATLLFGSCRINTAEIPASGGEM